jgi:hypothetical protein
LVIRRFDLGTVGAMIHSKRAAILGKAFLKFYPKFGSPSSKTILKKTTKSTGFRRQIPASDRPQLIGPAQASYPFGREIDQSFDRLPRGNPAAIRWPQSVTPPRQEQTH